ncbi:hypothetical protein GCM10020256_60450 [Streptomyces thermocoprophilus]
MGGLAGLRIGYVVSSPEVIAALERAQPLWPVSTPALAAAQACVAPAALAEAEDAARAIAGDRAYLVAGLTAFAGAGLRVVTPAEGPFVLVRVPGAADVRRRLRERGWAVRRGDTFPGLDADWLRLAVRDRRTTDGFLAALGGGARAAVGAAGGAGVPPFGRSAGRVPVGGACPRAGSRWAAPRPGAAGPGPPPVGGGGPH